MTKTCTEPDLGRHFGYLLSPKKWCEQSLVPLPYQLVLFLRKNAQHDHWKEVWTSVDGFHPLRHLGMERLILVEQLLRGQCGIAVKICNLNITRLHALINDAHQHVCLTEGRLHVGITDGRLTTVRTIQPVGCILQGTVVMTQYSALHSRVK